LGQFATPPQLAHEIVTFAQSLLPSTELIRFLDPAFGTGSFYSALLQVFPVSSIACARGYEIDSHYGEVAQRLWSPTRLELTLTDFTTAKLPVTDSERANLLICNPPYVRHHHLTQAEKLRLQELVKQVTGIRLNGLSGLYCYFLLLAHAWLAEGGLACCRCHSSRTAPYKSR
jgi:adenine-specific DNA-methyltransferase